MRASLQVINDKADRPLPLQPKGDERSQAIASLKTLCRFAGAGIAFLATTLKDWLFGQK